MLSTLVTLHMHSQLTVVREITWEDMQNADHRQLLTCKNGIVAILIGLEELSVRSGESF
jgi:hypothetical protein